MNSNGAVSVKETYFHVWINGKRWLSPFVLMHLSLFCNFLSIVCMKRSIDIIVYSFPKDTSGRIIYAIVGSIFHVVAYGITSHKINLQIKMGIREESSVRTVYKLGCKLDQLYYDRKQYLSLCDKVIEPPRWMEFLLAMTTDEDMREYHVGDSLDRYQKMYQRYGRFGANIDYLKEVSKGVPNKFWSTAELGIRFIAKIIILLLKT